jgi:hypothetical protein
MKATRIFSVFGALLFPLGVVAFTEGCGEKEEEEAKPKSTSTATAAATTAEVTAAPPPSSAPAAEVSAAVSASASASASASTTVPKPTVDPVARCCSSLSAAQRNAPLDQQGTYAMAIAACNAARGNPALARQAAAMVGKSCN